MISPAVEADVAEIVALEHHAFGSDAWSGMLVRERLGSMRVARDETGRLVGYVVAAVAGDVADLERIAVAAPDRRHGLGGDLLDAAVRDLAGEADRMLLEVREDNAAALAFYRDRGFVEIDRRPRYYRDRSDALVLARALRTGWNHGDRDA